MWYTCAGLLLLAAGACKNGEQERAAQMALAHDSTLTQDSTELQRQKDSLLVSVQGLLQAMNSIDSAVTLAGIKHTTHHGEPMPPYQEVVRARTLQALDHLKTVQRRLTASMTKIKEINGQNTELQSQLASVRDMAASLQTQLTTQQARVDTLMQQLAMAKVVQDSLTTRTQQLGTAIDSMVVARQRVYMVTGTKDELERKGVVEEVGGTRFPWIVKVGATLRPTNTHPADSLFQTFDMLQERTIPLDPAKRYEIVSSQDLSGADRHNAQGRIFRGSIQITDPQKFWGPSPYLILRTL